MINNIQEYIEQIRDAQQQYKKNCFFFIQLDQIKTNYKKNSFNFIHLDLADNVKQATDFGCDDTSLIAFLKELCFRKLGLEAYDTQIIAALHLYEGKVIEMKTGEGKTLAAIIASCLHILNRHKVHIVTANDYLANRDYQLAKPVFEELGFTCGCLTSDSSLSERVASSDFNVLYTTNKEIATNYSNNRKAINVEQLVQNPFDVLIVDEADLIMIDEARKELVVGNNHTADSSAFIEARKFVMTLEEKDYKTNLVNLEFYLNDSGAKKAQDFFKTDNFYDKKSAWIRNAVKLAFFADKFYKKDVNYIVKNNEIVLINTQTGRLMNFYKMLNGMQQALECKEGLTLSEVRTNFTNIPYQHIFNQYKIKSGMTGTALTEAKEFKEIYNMDVVEILPNKPMCRVDYPDRLFATKQMRDKAVIDKIQSIHSTGQPILIGTASIEHSEEIATELEKASIPYSLLNAKHHEQEAQVIINAGNKGAVTIATNMAGRGTDIKVPNESITLGGLFILGTERYVSRRADNQLRGRTGRQGDIGHTQFYTSLEDEIISNLNVKRIKQLMMLLKNVEHKDYIENPTILNLYNKSQIALEGQYFDERKRMLKSNEALYTYYQNFFNRKLYFMRSGLTNEQVLDKLLSSFVIDKSKYALYDIDCSYSALDVQNCECKENLNMEEFNELFNMYWVAFSNSLSMLNVNMFLNFASIGNSELLYEKRVSEEYTKMVLQLKVELIGFLQKRTTIVQEGVVNG